MYLEKQHVIEVINNKKNEIIINYHLHLLLITV